VHHGNLETFMGRAGTTLGLKERITLCWDVAVAVAEMHKSSKTKNKRSPHTMC
jgi:hypothetical protein